MYLGISHLERYVSLVRIPYVKAADLALSHPQLWHQLHKCLVLLDQTVVGRFQYFLCTVGQEEQGRTNGHQQQWS